MNGLPSAIRIFLSCTRGDLDEDCRPAVLREIKLKAEAVDMDGWVNDFTDQAVDVCHHKLRDESSHYIGIFAYRRGWVPDRLREAGKSITQAEFEWACSYRKVIAVWVPDPASSFADELRQRADQSEDDEAAQLEFLKSLDSGMRNTFPDPVYLSNRVNDKVTLWRSGGLMQIASSAPSQASGSAVRPLPTDMQALLERKHAGHRQDFGRTLEELAHPGAANSLCWLIHGDGDFGQDQLADQLLGDIQHDTAPPHKRVTVQVGVSWRGRNLQSVISAIAADLGEQSITSLEHLIAVVREALEKTHVVLKLKQIHRLQGAFPAFAKDLWQPLIAGLGDRPPRRLFAVLTSEQEVGEECEALVRAPSADDLAAPTSPSLVVRPPRLTPFRPAEVSRWLGRWIVDPEDAFRIAESLVQESRGYPHDLFRRLADDEFWAELEQPL